MYRSLIKILNAFDQEKISYCILHGWQELPEELSSDLDIVIASEDLPRLERVMLEGKVGRLVNLLQHESTCYYFLLASERSSVVYYLPVDAAVDYRRDGRVWFTAEELLWGRRRWKEFWVAAPEVEFKYLLVKKILKENLPEHAAERLHELAETLGEQAYTITNFLLGRQWAKRVMHWIRSKEWQAFEKSLPRLKKLLKRRRLLQDPLNPLRYWLPEFRRFWLRWRYPTGLWIAVLGPDGAGKSTLIQNLQEELKGAFRRTVIFHLMPGLLRKQSDGGPVTDPHGKPPRSWFVSLLKLAYYWLDYTLGYWLRTRPALVRSTLVLFDRYYDDLLVDPKRYRYGGSMWLARWLSRFIPRPDIWLILDVPEEEILRRKQEVPLEEIRRQRQAYRRLAMELPNAILLNGSLPPEEVAREARDAVLEFLHERYLTRRHIWFRGNRKQEALEWAGKALRTRNDSKVKPFLYLALPDGRGYLLPRNSRKAALQALSLCSPQKLKAKAVKSLLGLGIRTGIAQHVLPRASLDLGYLRSFSEEVFHRKDLTLAVSLGTPGPHRKPVVQVLTEKGKVLGYVKVGWNEETSALVCNEAETLHFLNLNSKNLPFLVPQVLYAGEWKGRFILVQLTPPKGAKPAPGQWGNLYQRALEGMASLGVVQRRLVESAFWQKLEQRVEQISSGYQKRVLIREMENIRKGWGDQMVPFHLAHGDFAPWNALVIDDRLYLYDWEYSGEKPAGYDRFHFWVQTLGLVKKRDPAEIVAVIRRLDWASDKGVLFSGEPKAGLCLFRLYLLARFSQVSDSFLNGDAKLLLGLLQVLGGAW